MASNDFGIKVKRPGPKKRMSTLCLLPFADLVTCFPFWRRQVPILAILSQNCYTFHWFLHVNGGLAADALAVSFFGWASQFY
jgi:hypothetical protein